MTKNNIVSEFINSKFESLPSLNPDVYDTNYSEIAKMYDTVKEVLESKTNWQDFLKLEHAINEKGDIRQDRETTFTENKKTTHGKAVFKYFVYNWLKRKIEQQESQLGYVQEMSWEEMGRGFEGLINLANKTSHIEAMAKGLKKAKAALEAKGRTTLNIDKFLELARKRYILIKSQE